MTRIYWADASPFSDSVMFEAAKNKLPPHRLQKLQKLKFRQDQNLSIASWLVLSESLKGFPGYEGNENIVFQKNGKPVFADNSKVYFNISHSGQVAVCAVSCYPVGVDVQLVCDFKEEICRRYFASSEADFILKQKDLPQRKDSFFNIWTLKEAYSKMTGGGLGEFKKFEISVSPAIQVKTDGILDAVSFEQFDIPGYKTAVCVGGDEKEFEFKRINLIKLLIN